MELEHVMSQAVQDRYGGETRHDNEKLKLTNVTKCSGRNTHQGATRKLNSMNSRVEEVCLQNACMSNVHMTCPTPPKQRNHKGWRSAPDAILPGHRWHPSGSRQGHPRYTGDRTTGRPWVARHQRHNWRSQDATHHPTTPKHQSSDKHGSGAGDHQQEVTIYLPIQKTVEVPQELIEMTTLLVTNQNATTEQPQERIQERSSKSWFLK